MKALGSWSLVALLACGGSEPPARTAPPAAAAASDSSGAAPVSPPTRAAPSAELSAGIKAFDAGNYSEARSSFQAAVNKSPNDADALYDLGMACEKLGDKAAAAAAYTSALTAKPDLEAASIDLSALYIDEGRIDEALAVGRAGLAKHSGSSKLHENLAAALAARGSQDLAIKEFEAAIEITPAEPLLQLAFAHWLNVWHVRGAGVHLDAAGKLAKNDYALVASIAHEYRMAGEFDSCVKTYDHAVAIKDGGEVRTGRALCRVALKDEKAALDDLQAAVAIEPTFAPAHYYLGGRLGVAKRFKDAAAEYAKYLQLDPNGSLVKQASERLKAAQDAAARKK
jgi:Flp pilus assembly protein TadD